MSDELAYFGITHRSAPLAVRERIAAGLPPLGELLSTLAGGSLGVMVLRTCERIEVYASGGCPPQSLCDQLSDVSGVTIAELLYSGRGLQNNAAAEQLLRVAAGLDSRIVGETHILGQVRAAYLASQEAGRMDAVLSAVARAAIHTGKRVRHETPVLCGARSIVALTMDQITGRCGRLADRTALVIGTGALAAELVRALATRGIGRIVVASRSPERAASLAARWDGTGIALEKLAHAIAQADAIIACTSAPSYVLDRRLVGARSRTLLIVDLGVPRNVDPQVRGVQGVQMAHMEEFTRDDEASPAASIGAAEAVVAEELDRFRDWVRARRVAPLIASLMNRAPVAFTEGIRAEKRRLHGRIVRLKQEAAA